jgi:hypothetical protein
MVRKAHLPPSHRSTHHTLTAAVEADHASASWLLAGLPLVADISSDPDLEAVRSGVEAGVTVLVVAIGALVVFGLFRWGLSRLSNGE